MPDYEQLLEDLYTRFLRPGNVAIDVGAHTGRHTVPMMRAVAPTGEVYAFEPLPSVRADLRLAVSGRQSEANILPYALADREGTEEFVVALDLPAYSGLRARIYDRPTRLERIHVEVRSLDRLFANVPRIDYIKIDAEGGELAILRGATTLLRRWAPVVTFEFGANCLAGYGIRVEDMVTFWADKPYVIFDVLGRRLDSREFADSAVRQEVWDYVAVPIVRVAQMQALWMAMGSELE